jgi:hypothetical protein
MSQFRDVLVWLGQGGRAGPRSDRPVAAQLWTGPLRRHIENGEATMLNRLEGTELPEITDARLRLLHDLWQIHRDGAPAPRQADLDVFDSPHWLGHLSLLEAIEDGLDFRYLIYGRALAAYYGRDLNGKTTRDLPAVVGNLVRREYLQAYVAQRPVLVERRRRVRGVSIMIAKIDLAAIERRTRDRPLACRQLPTPVSRPSA